MDLSSMLNDGPPEKKVSHASPPTRAAWAGNAPQVSTLPPAPNGAHTEGVYAPARAAPGQQTPQYGPSSASISSQSQSQSRGLTPLHTPSHAPVGQYPFPTQHPSAAHPGPQYRPHELYSATTPGARPPSLGYSAHPSPGPALGQYQHALNSQQSTSLSPTPSHHSQTPHSILQSPLAAMNHPSNLQQHQHHHSQPTTPLGPPQVPQRHPNQQMESPHHQRTFSSASNSIPAASPANHQPSIASIVDSPSVYPRPSPSRRQTSEYRSSVDRERSVSVSPKTMIPPRPPSLGSRQSSQQDVYSARSSQQPSTSVASISDTSGHVRPPTPTYAQPHSGSYPESDVFQGHHQASGGQYVNGTSLSPADNKTPLQHQPQKMVMSHLLAPTQHVQQQNALQNGSSNHMKAQEDDHSQFNSSLVPSQQSANSSASSQAAQEQVNLRTETPHSAASSGPAEVLEPFRVAEAHSSLLRRPVIELMSSDSRLPLKRPADSEHPIEPASKRGRKRKFTERPIWAHLSYKNPRYGQPGVAHNGTAQPARPQNQPHHRSQPHNPNGAGSTSQSQIQQNMTQSNADGVPDKPWLRDPPLDEELINARGVLGGWEKSFRWNVPIPPLTKAVMDWLFQNLERNADIGNDPREGCIEIEAKIGTLIDRDTEQRCNLPVENATVISVRENKKYKFNSEMTEVEHKNMNRFLNEATQRSCAEKGRIPINYEHIRETDSFQFLSVLGYKNGQVSARIVKIPVGDHLHIFGANEPYDVRISMNLEINLDKPELDPSSLTEEPTDNKPAPPNRKKDRLSYRHLAFHVDLTRVDTVNMAPKYELELEVDASALRQQIELAKNQQKNAYMEVVDGFIANILWLMKQQR